MACSACAAARKRLGQAVRAADVVGVASAIATGVAINYDKLRGVDVNAKYGNAKQATPYKRTK